MAAIKAVGGSVQKKRGKPRNSPENMQKGPQSQSTMLTTKPQWEYFLWKVNTHTKKERKKVLKVNASNDANSDSKQQTHRGSVNQSFLLNTEAHNQAYFLQEASANLLLLFFFFFPDHLLHQSIVHLTQRCKHKHIPNLGFAPPGRWEQWLTCPLPTCWSDQGGRTAASRLCRTHLFTSSSSHQSFTGPQFIISLISIAGSSYGFPEH